MSRAVYDGPRTLESVCKFMQTVEQKRQKKLREIDSQRLVTTAVVTAATDFPQDVWSIDKVFSLSLACRHDAAINIPSAYRMLALIYPWLTGM